ncbi:hypothetical protein [Leucobacter sp. 1207-22]|uniref:hypothetical protein n=1 Tax=Leucobacter sp. 1207-22 TaxID=2604456 RepID=UPI004063DCF2
MQTPAQRVPRTTKLDDHFVKLEDAGERAGKSQHTIYRWIRDERVKVMRINGVKRLSVPDLLQAELDTRR